MTNGHVIVRSSTHESQEREIITFCSQQMYQNESQSMKMLIKVIQTFLKIKIQNTIFFKETSKKWIIKKNVIQYRKIVITIEYLQINKISTCNNTLDVEKQLNKKNKQNPMFLSHFSFFFYFPLFFSPIVI